jgi:hypothetical protein
MNWRRTAALGWAVGAGLALGAPETVGAKELWVQPAPFVAPALSSFPWPTSGSGVAGFAWSVPDDFASLQRVTVSLVPRTSVTGTFDVYGSVKADGELATADLLFSLAVPATLAAGTVQEIEITALLAAHLDASSAGRDYASVFLWFPAEPGLTNATVLGLRFGYAPVAAGTNDLENGAVTSPKLAPDSVDSAKVVDGSLTGADLQNGSVRGEDVDRTQVQARVATGCGPDQAIRTIQQNGEVVCQSIGLDEVSVETLTQMCPPGMCTLDVTCPDGKRVMGGGFELPPGFGPGMPLNASRPLGTTQWRVRLINVMGANVPVDVFAVCSVTGETIP